MEITRELPVKLTDEETLERSHRLATKRLEANLVKAEALGYAAKKRSEERKP